MIRHGDCRDVMRSLDPDSLDAIVCDPPYGLAFMGKEWDHGVPGVEFWAEALRVAKPGAYLVAFGGTRTFHRLACAIEDAGWEMRDCLSWLYGSGFPKSHNGEWGGTALKPAWEPIILARKPLIGTVAKNVETHGTGGLNIDGCRIGADDGTRNRPPASPASSVYAQDEWTKNPDNRKPFEAMGLGRWPANVVLDEEAGRLLDAQSGETGASAPASGPTLRDGNTSVARGAFNGLPADQLPAFYDDAGGASRFFYCAKASRSEREAGLEGMPERVAERYGEQGQGPLPRQAPRVHTVAANHHPTVKPLALMRWLCRLVTPKGGVILDPFCGSGSTGCAAVQEGFQFIGIEKELEYVGIAEKRIAHCTPAPSLL